MKKKVDNLISDANSALQSGTVFNDPLRARSHFAGPAAGETANVHRAQLPIFLSVGIVVAVVSMVWAYYCSGESHSEGAQSGVDMFRC